MKHFLIKLLNLPTTLRIKLYARINRMILKAHELRDDISAEVLIRDVLEHVEDYQALVDKNRETAERNGSWNMRMKWLMEELKENYDV